MILIGRQLGRLSASPAIARRRLLSAACAKTVHEVTPPVPVPAVEDIEVSLYLIGDAGAPA